MKFLQDNKTGSVFIANDDKAEKILGAGTATEITREKYAEIMDRRGEVYTILQSGNVSRRVHLVIDGKTWHSFESRLKTEGIVPANYEHAIVKLVELYADGAMIRKIDEHKKETNTYLRDHT